MSDPRRRGYATEIGRAGLDFAFGELGATEVWWRSLKHTRRREQ